MRQVFLGAGVKQLGFKSTAGGAHLSRTMMISELTALLESRQARCVDTDAFRQAVIEQNCLGKRSASTRSLTWGHLVDLYGLDPNLLTFRGLLWFWDRDDLGRPLLALCASLARDQLLADTVPFVLSRSPGITVPREALEAFLEERFPGRFSPATRKSVAQNINATLTQSGHLSGRVRKVRTLAQPTAASVAYALLLGHASGRRGPELFQTRYMKVQDVPTPRAIELAEDAARRGWIAFKRVADVMEVGFPGLIRPDEEALIREQA
jgi:hypothetical protein